MIVECHRKPRVVRKGAHLVEFAFVFPVYVLFIFALIEFGRAMMVNSMVTNAARSGCRVGIVPYRSTKDVTNAVDAILQGQGVAGYTTTVCVNGSSTTDVSAAQTADQIQVTITIPSSKTSWLPTPWFLNTNITGQFSMPHE